MHTAKQKMPISCFGHKW